MIQIVQLGQYRKKSANTDFFLVLVDFDLPATQGLITRPIQKSSWKSSRNDIFID
jgi:hypothetical protein